MEKSQQFRLTGFLDAGNVFESIDDFDAGDLRYSTGFSTVWFAGIGIITMSLGFFPSTTSPATSDRRFSSPSGRRFRILERPGSSQLSQVCKTAS